MALVVYLQLDHFLKHCVSTELQRCADIFCLFNVIYSLKALKRAQFKRNIATRLVYFFVLQKIL